MIFKKLGWIINCCLYVLRLKKRDHNIWIFGSWNGENYSDNSKYLFEYVNQNLPQIKAIWITKNRTVKQTLLSENKTCYLADELLGRKIRLKAGVVFFTNGVKDLGNFDLSHGAIKVALWHGMPLKRLHFATNNLKRRNKSLIRYLQYLHLKIYNNTQRDFTIATSELTKQFLIECFKIENDSVWITGQPRNDIFFKKNIGLNSKKLLHLDKQEKIILYMPTWRNFRQKESFLEKIIEDLQEDKTFNYKLKQRQTKLIIKPHPRIEIKTESTDNIIIIKDKNISPEELLAMADCLITDYSSVFIDYSLLQRPIYFFAPDLEEYKQSGNGLFLDLEDFVDFWIKDLADFKKILSNSELESKGISNSLKINKLFNEGKLREGEYSKNVYHKLKEIIPL